MFGFGKALDVLRDGDAVRRPEWPGIVLVLVPAIEVPVETLPRVVSAQIEGEEAVIAQSLLTVSQAGVVNDWLPTDEDLLAEDWDYAR